MDFKLGDIVTLLTTDNAIGAIGIVKSVLAENKIDFYAVWYARTNEVTSAVVTCNKIVLSSEYERKILLDKMISIEG